ncbi:hypothetical protein ANO11243_094780 [Dothideomycetidae sp. 11243]|nr:hypothetical protein ANO11243_094780 [fungal sp. No.11243]
MSNNSNPPLPDPPLLSPTSATPTPNQVTEVSTPKPQISIRPATNSDIPTVRALFTAYSTWLSLDLSFQSYAEELASLPGKYAPDKGGGIWLAFPASSQPDPPSEQSISPPSVGNTAEPVDDGSGALIDTASPERAVGVVALRPLSKSEAELKRLYVLPSARGSGAGEALVVAALEYARSAGYRCVRLDTLPDMHGALRMYARLGFVRGERYYDSPLTETVWLRLDL